MKIPIETKPALWGTIGFRARACAVLLAGA